MRLLGPQNEHYWLALSMAKAAGVDLSAAIESGNFDQEAWAATVQKCRGCSWSDECKHWLRENAETDRVPDTCVNAALFAKLKELQIAEANKAH